MRRAATDPLYVSRNHLEGSLLDAPLDRVLAACRKHLVTGVVRVHALGSDGVVELRAGAVDRAHLGDVAGDRALELLRGAQDGWYEVAQRLPDLTGELGDAALMQGDIEGVPLIALMRHCEDHALTCTITVISGFDRACIEYRAGEIARIELNGYFDDDALPQIVHWKDARYRVAAPPLDLDIEGWPVPRRAPTAPFQVSRAIAAVELPPVVPRLPAVATPVPARARSHRPEPSAGSDAAWIALAAVILLALAIAGLVLIS